MPLWTPDYGLQKPPYGTPWNPSAGIPQPIGAWLLNDGAGRNAWDSSGNSMLGSIIAPTWVRDGLSFNGSSTTIQVPVGRDSMFAFSGVEPWTVFADVTTGSTVDGGPFCIVSKCGASSATGYDLFRVYNSGIKCFLRDAGNSGIVTPEVAVAANTRYRMAATYVPGGTLTHYIDGKSPAVGSDATVVSSYGNVFVIGARDGTDGVWNGIMHAIIVWRGVALSSAMVGNLFTDPFAPWRPSQRLWWYAKAAAPDLQTYTRAVDAWGSDAQVLTRAVAVYGSAVGALTAAVGACGADPQAVTRLLASYGYEAQALTRAGEAWGRDAQTIARAMEGYGADPGTLTKALVSFGFDFVTATRAVEAWASDPQTLTRALAAYGVDPLTLTRALDASGADPQALTRVLAAYGADSRAIEFAVALWGSNPQVLSPAMVAWAGDLRTLTLVVGAYGSLIATATAAIEAYGVDPGTYTRALAAFGSQLEAYTRELAAWGSDPQAASRGFEAWGVGVADTLLASMMAWAQSTGLLTFGAEAWGSLRVTGTVGLELWGASGAAAAGWLRAVLESGRYN